MLLKKENKKGFSFIEIIVAVVIMSIMVAIAAFNLSGSRARADESRIKNDMEVISLAEEKYYADHSAWSDAANPITRANATGYCTTMKDYISRCPEIPHADGAYTVTRDKQTFNVTYASASNNVNISRR